MILEELDHALALGASLERACEVLGVSVRTIQRWREQGEGGGEDRRRGPKRTPHNKLPPEVEAEIIEIATSPEYSDQSPRQIVPHLADHKKKYVASESSIYRVLAKHGLNKHRGRKRAPAPRPRALTATGPGQVYSWDITYLRTRTKGQFYYLYMVVDVWSRMIVASEVHEVEKDQLAMSMVEKACAEGRISGMSWLHSDNGAPMRSGHMLETLRKLGVRYSFSRPRVSDDNPFSESLFSTLKYRPNYPRSFPSLSAAREWSTTSSTGTTPSISTAGSASSPRTAATTANTRRSSSAAGQSTRPPASATPSAGASAAGPGTSTPWSASTPNATGSLQQRSTDRGYASRRQLS